MCESRSLPGFPFNIFIELAADMAQLVERTLGKGEVPSSTLGISTIEKNEALQIAAGLFVCAPGMARSAMTGAVW